MTLSPPPKKRKIISVGTSLLKIWVPTAQGLEKQPIEMEAASVVKSVIFAANQYLNHKADKNCFYLQQQLEILIGITVPHSGKSLKFFNPKNLQPTECLTTVIDILCDPHTKPSLLMSCITLLQNLATDDEIRQCLHDAFHLTPALAGILKTQGTAGDILSTECLSLLQKVTYGHKMNFQESYMEDLITFTVKQIHGPVLELTLPCLGLLVNLCRDNFAVQSYLKNSENIKALYKVLVSYLSDQNLTVIILSLSIITSLSLQEDLGGKILNAKNINQTFQMIFNILMKSDTGVTRGYAVDLFRDLLRNPKIQQSLSRFDRLGSCLENILNLIAASTPESVIKVFELLLLFCRVEGLRSTICKCVLATSPLHDNEYVTQSLRQPVSEVKEPLIAAVHWAGQSTDSHNKAPLYALDFLTEFYEELIYSNTRVHYSIHADLVLPTVLHGLQDPPDREHAESRRKCCKMVKVIQLLTVFAGEEDTKKKLCKMVDMSLFSGLLEHQFTYNRVALRCNKVVSPDEDWSEYGVDVVLCGLELMEKLKRSLPDVDALFCSTLQDSRLVPFLSAGMTSPDRSRVQTALQMITTASTLDSFPVVLLGDTIAANNTRQHERLTASPTLGWQQVEPKPLAVTQYRNKENMPLGNHCQKQDPMNQDASINSIIERMQSGLQMNEIKASEIIDIYEHKLQSLQTKEDQLQDLLDAKALALSQADRLIAQYRSRRAQYEAEAHKMRSMVQDSERRSEQYREQLNDVMLKGEHLQNELEQVNQEKHKLEEVATEHKRLTVAYMELSEKYESSEKSLLCLKQEHKTLMEMHEMLNKHNESLKHQHDVASEQLSKLSKQLMEKASELTQTQLLLEEDHTKAKKEQEKLEDCLDKIRANLDSTDKIKKKLEQKVVTLEKTVQQTEEELREKTEVVRELKSNVDKHNQIAALIHSLSSGKSDNESMKS
ncbi:protein CIP2A homolog isoform X2 [Mizuhopecten yessoensis]|uniref:protein CIP2A homolog isoform X2 n=1 Tax=Mizuhopecten yessoensis TaxID=6573 RepID=UPI000B45AF34|nr:protein CIP2A homolog isoform X2 [Mizuhopecten yessoensis]